MVVLEDFVLHRSRILHDNAELFDSEDIRLVESLIQEGQDHLFAHWPPAGSQDEDKRRLLAQLRHLDTSYTGGLVHYIRNARRLLHESRAGVNPFEGCVPSIPEGERLDFGSDTFRDFERRGVDAAANAAFVLVAGGLGERLGYSGIKVALPVESASNKCFLQHYIESILALQVKAQVNNPGRILPLAIMTSEDTHSRTQALLESNNYFGMTPDQVTLIKQEKVACLADNDARLALQANDGYQVQTKPHGHGDVHMLLHSSGLAATWLKQGFNWVCFFQDTNGLVFRGLPAALGVSAKYDYDVNSLAVPRKAKEAIGAITKLQFPDGHSITINVEYNQLDPLLRATINPEGDVNDPATGFSPLPGNINQLVLKLSTYVAELERHKGVIGEFVNPKYADSEKNTFKSSTRLECMMQDFPKSLPPDSKVGFTVVNQVWAAYSPVKNSPGDARAKAAAGGPSHSATTGELDVYKTNCEMLRMLGATIADPIKVEFNGIKDLDLWPQVVWSPLFACTFDDLASKIDCSNVKINSTGSTLVVNAPKCSIKALEVKKGAVVVSGSDDADIVIGGVVVENKGWSWQPLEADAGCKEEEYIRGFTVVKEETLELCYDSPGKFTVNN